VYVYQPMAWSGVCRRIVLVGLFSISHSLGPGMLHSVCKCADAWLPLQVYLPSKLEQAAVLRVLCPPNYPSAAGPVMELEAAAIPAQQLAAAVKHMEDMYCPGGLHQRVCR